MSNEKNIYESAKIEILTLTAEDVICTSTEINLPDIDLTEI